MKRVLVCLVLLLAIILAVPASAEDEGMQLSLTISSQFAGNGQSVEKILTSSRSTKEAYIKVGSSLFLDYYLTTEDPEYLGYAAKGFSIAHTDTSFMVFYLNPVDNTVLCISYYPEMRMAYYSFCYPESSKPSAGSDLMYKLTGTMGAFFDCKFYSITLKELGDGIEAIAIATQPTT